MGTVRVEKMILKKIKGEILDETLLKDVLYVHANLEIDLPHEIEENSTTRVKSSFLIFMTPKETKSKNIKIESKENFLNVRKNLAQEIAVELELEYELYFSNLTNAESDSEIIKKFIYPYISKEVSDYFNSAGFKNFNLPLDF